MATATGNLFSAAFALLTCALLEIRAISLSLVTRDTSFSPFLYSILHRPFPFHIPVHAFVRALSPPSSHVLPPSPTCPLSLFAFAWLFLYPFLLSLRPSVYLPHGCNSATAKANQEGLSR